MPAFGEIADSDDAMRKERIRGEIRTYLSFVGKGGMEPLKFFKLYHKDFPHIALIAHATFANLRR